jgi:hypothetical protein
MKKWMVVLMVLIGMRGNAQITFQKTYGGINVDQAYSVQQTTDGGYIMVGYTQLSANTTNVYLIKTNAYGDTLWTKTYGGTYDDQGYCVQQTTDGGYIIVGETQDFGAGWYDVYLIKTKSNGDTLWTRTYGGVNADLGVTVRQTTDGGYIISGHTANFGAPFHGWNSYLIKTDASGDTLWTKSYGNGAMFQELGDFVQQTNDGGYIISGSAADTINTSPKIYLIKTNSFGDTLWTRTYGDTIWGEKGEGVQQTNDGGYIIFCNNAHACLIKTNSNGDTLWTRSYGGSGGEIAFAGQQTTDGGYILAGYTTSFAAQYGNNIYLVKTNSNGDTLWSKTFGDYVVNSQDIATDVHQTTDGGYIITGYTATLGSGTMDIYLIKTDSLGNSGCHQWNPATVMSNYPTQVNWINSHVFNGGLIKSHLANVGIGGTVYDLCSTEGINEITPQPTISLFPNPFSTTATLSIRNYELGIRNGEVQIINLLGQEVKTIPIINQNEITINRDNLADGMYFYKIIGDKGESVAVGKMVIE